MADLRRNVVTWRPSTGPGQDQRLYLRLEGDLVRSAGIKPDLVSATVSYREFDKLAKDWDRAGILEFWFRSGPGELDASGLPATPDVRLDQWWIVDLEPLRYGRARGAAKSRVVEYRLFLADRRHRLVWPRGGHLTIGEINKEPFDVNTGKDALGNPLRNNKEIVDLCLKAMGLTENAPATLTRLPALKNLKWRGNHAPTELEKILGELNHVLTLRQDGSFQIFEIGDATGAEIPQTDTIEADGFAMPLVDRRGKVVVFASFPTAVTDTRTITGLKAKRWQLVCPDIDGQFKTIDQHSLLSTLDLEQLVRDGFAEIPERYRDTIRNFLFRCIRLDPDEFGAPPLLRKKLDGKGLESAAEFEALVAVQGTDGLWRNSASFVQIPVWHLYENGSVVQLQLPLLKLMDPVATDHPEIYAKAIGADDLRGTVSLEVLDKQADGSRRPRYFFCGFQQSLGRIVKLTPEEVQTAIEGKDSDRLIVARPELRLFLSQGEPINQKELEDRCELLAPRFVRGSGSEAKVYISKGFVAGNLNGLVARIKYSQEHPQTTFEVLTWWAPHASYLMRGKESDAAASVAGGSAPAGGAYPAQAAESGQRMAMGASGATQPAVPVMPSAVQREPIGRIFVVSLVLADGNDGDLTHAPTYRYDVYHVGETPLTGQALLAKAAPEVRARAVGQFAQATYGLAYVGKDQKVHLWQAHETPRVVSCEEVA